MRKQFAVAFIVFSLVAFSVLMVHPAKASPKTITVPDDYPTIQAAIDGASDGDTVFVKKGTYSENLTVAKSLSLVGENRETTIVVGEGNTAVLVRHDNVNVTGFTFRRPSTMRWYYGVHLLNVQHCNVFGNKIESTFFGIWLVDASFNNVYENTLNGDWNGIHLSASHSNNISKNQVTGSHDWGISTEGSDNNIIMHNYIASSGWGGIGLDGGSPNRNNLIAENTVAQCGDVGIGITSSGSTSNKIIANNITGIGSEDGGDVAILLGGGDSNLVEGNRLTGNQGGIYFEASQSNIARRNLIENNQEGGGIRIHGFPSKEASNNVVYENNIINNPVALSGNIRANTWDFDSRGNYWSDYGGSDRNGDGVGDTPYTIDSANVDHYPLMTQVSIAVNTADFLPSPTLTPTPSPSPSPSPTPSPTQTPSPSPMAISTPTPTLSPSPTPLETQSSNPTPSLLPTESSKTLKPLQPVTIIAVTAATVALVAAACTIAFVLRKR